MPFAPIRRTRRVLVLLASAVMALVAVDAMAEESATAEAASSPAHLAPADPASTPAAADDGVAPEEVDRQAGFTAPPVRARRAVRVRRPAGPDPWRTRSNVSLTGASSTSVDARMPLGAIGERHRGAGSSGAMQIDMHGRVMGFHLGLAGTHLERKDRVAVQGISPRQESALSTAEARASVSFAFWRSSGVLVAAGPAIEGRLTTVGGVSDLRASAGSWQSVIAGGDLRARVFVGRHLYVAASTFAGVRPIAGGWQAVKLDPAAMIADGGDSAMTSSALRDARVFAGTAALGLRPAEPLAISAGVTVRHTSYRFADGTSGSERGLRPFVGLDLFY